MEVNLQTVRGTSGGGRLVDSKGQIAQRTVLSTGAAVLDEDDFRDTAVFIA